MKKGISFEQLVELTKDMNKQMGNQLSIEELSRIVVQTLFENLDNESVKGWIEELGNRK